MVTPRQRGPLLTGWCSTPYDPATYLPTAHDRCPGGQAANPDREWQPCPCVCHTPDPSPEDTMSSTAQTPDATPATAQEPVVDRLRDALDRLTAAADDVLACTAPGWETQVSWVEATILLRRLRAATRTAGYVDNALVQHIYLTGEHGDVDLGEGVGLVKITRGRDRKEWDRDAVVDDYIDQKLSALQGEVPATHEVVRWMRALFGAVDPKVTPMKDAGLDPGEYAKESPGKIGVSFLSG